ncbi:SPOR domain-containing protein, partial [Kaarinaea lacus]
KPLIRVILFATEKIKEQIKDPLLGHLANLPIRSLELPPLSEEQTVHYIMHRTLAANFNGNDIFNESAILKIYRESFGWPARINETCHNLLLKTVPSKNLGEMPEPASKAHNPKQLLVAGIAIAVLAAVLVFQDKVSEFINQKGNLFSHKTEQSKPVAQVTETSTTGQTTLTSQSTETSKPETLVEKLKSRDPSYQGTAGTPGQADEKTGSSETMSTAATQEKMPGAPEPIAEQKPAKQPDNIKIGIKRGNDWLLLQDSRHYTLQVVAGESLNTIDDFVKEHQLKDDIALYNSLRKNKPWYGLVYGLYENKQQAVTATNQPKLKKFNPWIRELGGIQKDIRKLPANPPEKQVSLVEKLSKPQPAQKETAVQTISASQVQPVEIPRQEQWIQRQRYNHYTLQLMASEHIEAVYRFVRKHNLKDSIALYKIHNQDKTWHVLIYGIYSSESLAESGIGRLPTDLQQVKPVIRQFSDIHKEIKKTSP